MSRTIARVLAASALAVAITGGTAAVATHQNDQVVVAGSLGCCKK